MVEFLHSVLFSDVKIAKQPTYLDSSDSVSNDLNRKNNHFNTRSLYNDLFWITILKSLCLSKSLLSKAFTSDKITHYKALPTTLSFWQWREMADIEEIQEYLWKNLIFHDYSLHTHAQKNQMVIPEYRKGAVCHCVISFVLQTDQYLEVEL